MKVVTEQLVDGIVRAVLAELCRRGVEIAGPASAGAPPDEGRNGRGVEIDFSDYKTPVLTERHVRSVGPGIARIVVPPGTHCTAGAKDLMKERKLTLTTKNPSH